MRLSDQEWHLLSYLLSLKPPNRRECTLLIQSRDLLLEGGIKFSRDDMKRVLALLEEKGIIRVKGSKIEEETRPITSEETDPLSEIRRLNLMFIINQYLEGDLREDEYERKFNEVVKKISSERGHERIPLIPLTRINRLLEIMRLALLDLSLGYPDLRELSDLIREKLASYVNFVKDNLEIGSSEISLFAYLYPFIKPLIGFKKEFGDPKQIESVEREIRTEKEIIHVLKDVLNEGGEVMRRHQARLESLYQRLDTLKKDVRLSVDVRGNLDMWNEDRLRELLRSFLINDDQLINEIFEPISLLIKLMRDGRKPRIPLSKLQEDLGRAIKVGGGSEGLGEVINVELLWMNDECPIMQDSILESGGDELYLCPNRDISCLTVYHKKCVEILRNAGNARCLVCGMELV